MLRRARLPALLLVALAAAPLPAQDAADAAGPTDARLVSALARVDRGAELRVRWDARLDRGALEEVGPDSLRLRAAGEAWGVPLRAVDTLWVRGRATGPGAVIGGVTGAVTVGALAALVSVLVCDAADCGLDLGFALTGAAAGAVGGGLLGAGVGSLFPRWRLRYP